MKAARGILTARGGMTSHAAVVARGMGKPCVAGVGAIAVDYAPQTMTVTRARRRRRARSRQVSLRKGDVLTIDGGSGCSLPGRGADGRGGAQRRVRRTHDVGRRRANHARPGQRRQSARRAHRAVAWRRRHRPLPHRAHVLRGGPHRPDARDDPRRRRAGARRRARQAPAVPARGLPRALPRDARPAGHHSPSRPAAPRVLAERTEADRAVVAGDGLARPAQSSSA